MAHHKSAKKRIRSDAAKNARNHSYISSVRSAVKKFRNSAEAGVEKETMDKLFVSAQSLLTRAATKGIIHKNNAARKVARLAKVLKDLHEGKAPVPLKQKKSSGRKKAALRKKKAKKK